MIPAFVTSTMRRTDLLERLLGSIDVPVARGLVVDNGHTGWTRPPDLRDWMIAEHGERWAVMQPPFGSLGWPGTLNFGIMQMPDAPWWLLVNDDAWFEPGKLTLLCELMVTSSEPVVRHHEWTVVALNRAAVERVGLFDEWSFWPLYFDDTDYAYRCHLAGVDVLEGDWCKEGEPGHAGERNQHAATVRSDPELGLANNRTWQLNRQAYVAKWGGPPGRETFTTPWGRDVPLWATKPDVDGRVARAW